jgi:hypothetical protein
MVAVLPMSAVLAGRLLGARLGTAPTSWCSPRGGLTEKPVLATFGPPRQIYHDGVYTVLVWNKNLLPDLNR